MWCEGWGGVRDPVCVMEAGGGHGVNAVMYI